MMKKFAFYFLFVMVALALVEVGLRRSLFKNVSYSNSDSIDAQLAERNAASDWNMLFVGDSEARWGIDPAEVDAAFRRRGIPAKSFNHAFDGFGVSWWQKLLPLVLKDPSLKRVEVVVVGVQLVETHGVIEDTQRNCGAMQKPVLTSPMAIDLGVADLCRAETWDTKLGRRLFNPLWTVRYSSAVRSMLMPKSVFPTKGLTFNSAKDGPGYHGYEPHRSIGNDLAAYDAEYIRWKAQYNPADLKPLDPATWQAMTADDGFFSNLKADIAKDNRRLALFALPTNPRAIDTFKRRDDYARNSKLLSAWARRNGVIFVDLGIRDVSNPTEYFSDARHLSRTGAKEFSRNLGDAMAAEMLHEASAGGAK